MSEAVQQTRVAEKFSDPEFTADGAPRAEAPFVGYTTLWINTGTLCNIQCANCYIESSPTNDALAYISLDEAIRFIDQAKAQGASEIGFTGGEPFMNPDATSMIAYALQNGLKVLVLTNAMRPMMRGKVQDELRDLISGFGGRLVFRVSLDHFTPDRHDQERTSGAFEAAISGIRWLADEGAKITIAGRRALSEDEPTARSGFGKLLEEIGIDVDAAAGEELILFPEMAQENDPPEITDSCWRILGKEPSSVMCATSRMVVKHKHAKEPSVVACTLLPYDKRFELGRTLESAARPVKLAHPFCASFCVLGGASCSANG